jgi:hypothetical protein
MSRILTAFNAAALVSLMACAGGPGGPTAADGPRSEQAFDDSDGRGTEQPKLSPAAIKVSQVASRKGDRNYLMVDKVRGEIIIFQNGRPVYSGSALTGESPGDDIRPGALTETFTIHSPVADKVTPAGRFTVSSQPDSYYGETLDINEIQGKDWDIAIHAIFLGFPREHRDARLRSRNGDDKHITYGCIDVSRPTMNRLLASLPNEDSTPIYILPRDETKLARYFPLNGAFAKEERISATGNRDSE